MARDTAELAEKIDAAQASNGTRPRTTLRDLIEAQRPQIERALPNGDADRLVRVALTTLRATPKLAQCTPESFLGALMLAAQLGLEPPGPLGHTHFVPRRNNRLKADEVTFIIGYKGLVDLALRSERISSIEAHEVYDQDQFEAEYGTQGFLRHRPDLRKRAGEPWAYYGLAKYRDGGHYFLTLSREDVEARRERSSTATSDRSPWKSDYDAMARKTAIRAMAPFLPLSVQAAQAIAQDETVHTEISPDMADQPIEVEEVVAEEEPEAES